MGSTFNSTRIGGELKNALEVGGWGGKKKRAFRELPKGRWVMQVTSHQGTINWGRGGSKAVATNYKVLTCQDSTLHPPRVNGRWINISHRYHQKIERVILKECLLTSIYIYIYYIWSLKKVVKILL